MFASLNSGSCCLTEQVEVAQVLPHTRQILNPTGKAGLLHSYETSFRISLDLMKPRGIYGLNSTHRLESFLGDIIPFLHMIRLPT
jgi:hypothetical protein